VLDEAARADIRAEVRAARIVWQGACMADALRATLEPLARRLAATYGREAFPELRMAVSEIIGGRSPAEAWLIEQATQQDPDAMLGR
jgi:hypothetical protein